MFHSCQGWHRRSGPELLNVLFEHMPGQIGVGVDFFLFTDEASSPTKYNTYHDG
jgi:hypothetical protein